MGHTGKHQKEQYKKKLKLKSKLSKKNKHRARLIVRNLPFDVTEVQLREHFAKFGDIDEIKLLKKEDGVLVGCGFVQFKLVQKAAKAKHHLHGKPFLNRIIECDWALPKDSYRKNLETVEPVKIKEELLDNSEVKKEEEIKQEIGDDQIKEEFSEDDQIKEEFSEDDQIKEEFLDNHLDTIREKNESDNLTADNDEVEDEIEEEDSEDEKNNVFEVKEEIKPKVFSNDVVEGKTIFIKNVPFTAANDDIKKCMLQFGPLYYGLICIDKLTEHSRGTAFVKFKNKEDADKCLEDKGIMLMGNLLDCERALSKDELNNKSNKKEKGPKDSRNLYLVKEGVILAGSKAAESVSEADMAKRLQVEQYKTQMLKNLNMFVARTRLVVHNIPPNWNDAKLKQLFLKHCGHNNALREARIMRNMRELDSNGIGRSKEYGFVSFTTHDAALKALRDLNNNPNIFSVKKRPIIAFSIENRSKLQARERRLQNSKLKNPTCKSYDPNGVRTTKKDNYKKNKTENSSFSGLIGKDSEELPKFSGTKATFGATKMRNKFNLRTQAQVHGEQVKRDKKRRKMEKLKQPVKQKEKKSKPLRQKLKNLKGDDNFAKLVNSYKQTLLNADDLMRKKKWYE